MPADPHESEPQAPAAEPRDATLPQVIGAVFWSFFGIRRGKHMRRDAVTIRPQQVIIVGVLAAVVFVLVLISVVRIIVRSASG
jgi:DUF2970 family protein